MSARQRRLSVIPGSFGHTRLDRVSGFPIVVGDDSAIVVGVVGDDRGVVLGNGRGMVWES